MTISSYNVIGSKPITAYLRPRVFKALENYREEQGINRSVAIEEIIDKYLSKSQERTNWGTQV